MPDFFNSALSTIDWLIIAGYFALIIGIGVLASRGSDDEKGFFLGGRKMPAWAVAMSFAATALSAATFIGGPEAAFKGDLTLLAHEIAKLLAALLVAVLFLPALYRSGCVTVYGYLGQRIGPGASTAASIMFLIGRVLASGARLFIAGTAFSLILYGNLDPKNLIAAIVLFGVVGTLYTALGGIRAVIWTDTLQLIVVVGAVIASIILLLRAIPAPVSEIYEALHAQQKTVIIDTSFDMTKSSTLWAAIVLTIFYAAAFGADQDMAQRLLTCKTLKQSMASLLGAILIAIPITALFMLTGLLLYVFYSQPNLMGDSLPPQAITDARQVYPQFLLNELPVGVRGLAMAGLFAAAMSSLDSVINAMASTVATDLLAPMRKKISGASQRSPTPAWLQRLIVVAMGVVLTLAAIAMVALYDPESDSLILFAIGVMTFAYAGLMGVFLAALLTSRGNSVSVVAALLVGVLVITASRYVPGLVAEAYGIDLKDVWWPAFPYWMAYATLASFLVCFLGPPRQTARL